MRGCPTAPGHGLGGWHCRADYQVASSHPACWPQVTGLLFLAQPFTENFGKRLTKSPKIYFSDTGLVWRCPFPGRGRS
jgi:hypothetical protein